MTKLKVIPEQALCRWREILIFITGNTEVERGTLQTGISIGCRLKLSPFIIFDVQPWNPIELEISAFLSDRKFSHDPSRLIKQPLRTYESYFAIRHKVAFRFDNAGSIARSKGPFNNAFAFNDHTIRLAAETKTGRGLIARTKSEREGEMARLAPESKMTGKDHQKERYQFLLGLKYYMLLEMGNSLLMGVHGS